MRVIPGFALGLWTAACEVRSLKIVGKDEPGIRTEDFVGAWIYWESGRIRDTMVFSGLTTRPAVLLSHGCAQGDSGVVQVTGGQGMRFLNFIDLRPAREEYSWVAFDRDRDTIRLHVPGSGFFAAAVKEGKLLGHLDSAGSVVLSDRSERIVSFLRKNRGTEGLFDGKLDLRLVRSPGACPDR